MLGGAVVALQPDHLGAGEVLLEAQDVVDFRAAPAIDRLVVIADAADVGAFAGGPLGQQPQPQILRGVGVLILVHQHVAELRWYSASTSGLVAEHADRQQADRRNRRRSGSAAAPGRPVERPALAVGKAAAVALGMSAGRSPCSSSRRSCWRTGGRPALVVDAFGLDELLEQADLIVGVENGEIGFQAHQFGMAAQELDADRVEGAEPGHALDRRRQTRRCAPSSRARPCW
jgi:hypothetical protein